MKITKIVQGAYQYLLLCLHFNLTSIKPGIDSKLLFLCTFHEHLENLFQCNQNYVLHAI